MSEYDKIPASTIRTINGYLTKGWEPGDFVRAVLENNLKMAVACADRYNAQALREAVCYVFNEVPCNAWGSREIVNEWIKKVGQKNEDERKETS